MQKIGRFVEDTPVSALTVGMAAAESRFLNEIFAANGWRIEQLPDLRALKAAYGGGRAGVVICSGHVPDGDWRAALEFLERKSLAPRMIVASAHADERLWAEVLNRGGYDLLLLPFDRDEVQRAVRLAWNRWILDRNGTMLPDPGARAHRLEAFAHS